MLRVLDRVFLMRPVLLGPVWTMVLVGHSRAREGGFGDGSERLGIVLVLFSLLMGGIYILNQVNDVEVDRLNNKLFLLADGWLSIKSALLQGWALLMFAIAGAFWLHWNLGALFLVSMGLGIVYNAGWKGQPILGLIANMVGFGFLAFAVGWMAASSHIGWKTVWCSIPYPFAIGAVYANTTVLDVEGDRKVGKETLAGRFGIRRTLGLGVVFVACAVGTAWILEDRIMLVSGGIALVLFGWMTVRIKNLLRRKTEDLLRRTENVCRAREERAIDQVSKGAILALSLRLAWTYPWYLVLMGGTFLGSRWYYGKRFGMRYPRLG